MAGLVGALGLLGVLLALAGAAAAHADLRSSSPRDGAVLTAEPPQAVLVFSEKVTPALSSVTVVGPGGRPLADGPPRATGTGGDSLAVRLRPDPGQGTFVLTWRTTASDDGHTTSGAVVFSVGTPSRVPAAAPVPGRPDRSTDAIQDVAVWLGFAGLALMVGFAAIHLYCLPPEATGRPGEEAAEAEAEAPGAEPDAEGSDAGSGTDVPAEREPDPGPGRGSDPGEGPGPQPAPGRGVRTAPPPIGADGRRTAVAAPSGDGGTAAGLRWPAPLGWAVLLAGTLVQLLAYGPAAQGDSPAHLLDRPLLSTTLSTHVGHTLVARIMLLAVVAALGDVLLRHRAAGAAAAAALTLLLALTWSEISHAPSGSHASLAVAVTTLHVTAMAVWAGGMATLAVLLTRPGGDARLATAAARFSRLALGCVAALAATGLYQAFRELGGGGALTGTHYGRLLLVKTGLFLLVAAVAAATRTRVRLRPRHGTSALRRPVVLELAGVTSILVVTVLLIATAPARHPAGAPPAPAHRPGVSAPAR